MLLIPAIDLKDGKCVRLKQGDMNQTTIFGENPTLIAQNWLNLKAQRLHLVDLNGAFAGEPKNLKVVQEILEISKKNKKNKNIQIQIGGGIRDFQTIEKYLNLGISYVIIGTKAITNPEFLKESCKIFPNKIIVGLDARCEKIAVNGWSEQTEENIFEIVKKFEDWGVNSIIYTDISRDGMLKGLNIDKTLELQNSVKIPIIASGGLSNIKDIEESYKNKIYGIICGRAIYSGDLDFTLALDFINKRIKE